MPQLTKGIYEPPYDHERPFDLYDGRCVWIRKYRAVKNAGWYNKTGEKLGWGDLSFTDLRHIADGLEDKEVFVLLSESTWRSALAWEGLDDTAPGTEYVIENAWYIIAPGKIYQVDRYGFEKRKSYQLQKVRFRFISREKARAIVFSCLP